MNDRNNERDDSRESKESTLSNRSPLEEGIDYYWEDGLMVFTAHFLLARGYCCESGCRHCPYGYKAEQLQKTSKKS